MLNQLRLLILSMHLRLLLRREVTETFSLHPDLFSCLHFNLEYLGDSWSFAFAHKLRVGVLHLTSALASVVFFVQVVRGHFSFIFSCFDYKLAVRRRIVQMLHRHIVISGLLTNASCTSFLRKNHVVLPVSVNCTCRCVIIF